MRPFVALLCVASVAVLPTVARHTAIVPAITVTSPNYQLSGAADDPCRIDYRNLRVFGEDRGSTARLRNGVYEQKFKLGYEAAKLKEVWCIDESNEKYAIVFIDWTSCGGSCTKVGVVQLVRVRSNKPTVIQQLTFDSNAVGTGAAFDKNSRVLTIVGRSDDGSPNCCAKNFDVAKFRWQGQRFVRLGFRQVPAPNGNSLHSLR